MQKILALFFFAFSISIFSQEYLNKNEKYDLEIYHHLDSLTIKNKIPVEEYLKFSKPFSKWDIRPIKYAKIWAIDSIYTSSEISNFFWGGFSQRYELTEKEAGDKPNQFLKQGHIDKELNINLLTKNIDKFIKLSSLITANNNQIYLNQSNLKRVDDLYFENDEYWKYLIPTNSPFPISTQIIIDEKSKFNSKQEKILNLMQEANIYSIYKTKSGIFYLIDGFTDNSYGYYFSSSKIIETDNHLFEISNSQNINDEFFYYIAN